MLIIGSSPLQFKEHTLLVKQRVKIQDTQVLGQAKKVMVNSTMIISLTCLPEVGVLNCLLVKIQRKISGDSLIKAKTMVTKKWCLIQICVWPIRTIQFTLHVWRDTKKSQTKTLSALICKNSEELLMLLQENVVLGPTKELSSIMEFLICKKVLTFVENSFRKMNRKVLILTN